MPDPNNVHYGKSWTYGLPEAREQFKGMASPELWEAIVNYKESRGPAPDPGQDYLMKQRRSPEDEDFVRYYLGEMIHGWGQPFSRDVMTTTNQTQPQPSPAPTATPTILERDKLLDELLKQKQKAQQSEAERYGE